MNYFDERMLALREKFVERARQESTVLGAGHALNSSELLAIAHRLSGSAGMFGFRQLSDCAEAVEEAVRRDETSELLQRLIDDLRAQIAAI